MALRLRFPPPLLALLLAALAPGCVVTIDNDLLGSDRNYTSGFRALHLFERPPEGPARDAELNAVQRVAAGVSDLVDVFDIAVPEHCEKRVAAGLVLGHAIFTPENLSATQLIEDDRPYAAWLYAGFVHSESALDRDPARRRDGLLYVELDLGVVGPAAQGERIQREVHQFIGDTVPQGWDNQLENEPALLLRVAQQSRDRYWGDGGGWAGDSISHWQVNLGNVAVSASVGNTWRWGWELPRSFVPGVGDRGTGPGTNGDTPDALYGFAGLEGRAVAHDIFLDGNTFRDSHSVDRIPLVGALKAGLAWHVDDWVVVFAHERRTREFEEQGGGGHAFSSVSVGYRLAR